MLINNSNNCFNNQVKVLNHYNKINKITSSKRINLKIRKNKVKIIIEIILKIQFLINFYKYNSQYNIIQIGCMC